MPTSVSSVRVRFTRPDGSVALDASPGVTFRTWRQTAVTWHFTPALDAVGPWRLRVDLDGRAVVDAPFDVVASEGQIVNRAPNAVTAHVVETSVGARRCEVDQDPVRGDPDYDLVRYRYLWTAAGRVVRTFTGGGLADMLPRTIAGPVTCTVTPSDGRLSGPTAQAAG